MPASDIENRPLTVVLIGNPNTGKSTLFSVLAGVPARIGNFPGVTVEKKVGRVVWDERSVELVDLPGTYSLSPRSLDEMVSVDVLLGRQADVPRPDVVVCIVDASNLERNFYLVSQLLDLGLPTVVALNMWDVADARGDTVDVERLSKSLGLAVVKTQAHRRQGVDELREAILAASQQEPGSTPRVFPAPFYDECERLTKEAAEDGAEKPPAYLVERLILDVGGSVEELFVSQRGPEFGQRLTEARERLREQNCRVPALEARVRYAWARETLGDVAHRADDGRQTTGSDRLDHVLTHRWFGLAFFGLLMFLMFQAIYRWAEPLMGSIEFVQEWISNGIASVIPPGALRSLLIDGVVAGVGGVLIFLPQIVLLFLFIAVLEDCGYMARAAFLMDKLMTRVGLSGKSFVPLMSSFACAIPGVMATRVIESRRDRMVTILVAPLMSCSARLPVYLLLIGAFIPATSYAGGWVSLRGLVLFAMTSLGAVVAIPVALLLKRTFFRGETPPFVMELPSYKWPSPRIVGSRVWERAKAFVTRAGTLIFATSILVWAAGYFPGDRAHLNDVQGRIEAMENDREDSPELAALRIERDQLNGALLEGSALGRLGKVVEPAVRPLGWDWRIGVGVIASFPAREVIIATLGTIYSLGGEVDEEDAGLMGAMRQVKWPDGRPVYSTSVALSLMVFFALCAQCGATLMVIRRETNSWRWPLFTFGYMTVLAYLGALLTYQVGWRLLG